MSTARLRPQSRLAGDNKEGRAGAGLDEHMPVYIGYLFPKMRRGYTEEEFAGEEKVRKVLGVPMVAQRPVGGSSGGGGGGKRRKDGPV